MAYQKIANLKGIKGDKGDAAVITDATATTLPAGATATVTAGGTSAARTFEFGIPKGDQGIRGERGLQGSTGPAGTFVSASVTVVAPTEAAAANVTGAEGAKHLSIKVPMPLPSPTAVGNDEAFAAALASSGSQTHSAFRKVVSHVSVKEFGAVGDGIADDTAPIQSAINSLAGTGGEVVFLPAGTYRVTNTLNLTPRTSLTGTSGSTIMDVSGIPDGIPALSAKGTLGAPQSLTADAAEGSTTMTPSNVAGLAVGDYLKLSSTDVFGSTSQPRGEFARIRSIDAGVVTFEDPLHDTYRAAADGKFQKASFVEDVTVDGIVFRGPTTARNIIATSFTLCRNLVVRGLRTENVHNTGVQLVDVVESSVSDCHLTDSKLAGLACGIVALYASQDITITNCTGARMRHLVATGGGMSTPGVSRRIAVSNCTASQMDDAGFDTHPASEYVSIIGCHVHGSGQDGIIMQSGRFVIEGCTVSGTTRHGIFVQTLTVRGMDGIVANNRINNVGSRGVSVGLDATAAYRTWSGLAVTGNIITDAAAGILVENASAEFSVPGVVVANNIVRRTKTSHGVQLRGLTAPVVSGNSVSGSGVNLEVLYLLSCPESVVSGNLLDGAGQAQRCLRLATSPDCAINGNMLKNATRGILNDTASTGLVYMGNRNLCATKGTWTGTGHVQSTADAAGAYNL